MNRNCKQCDSRFEVSDKDLEFLKKVSPVINDEKFHIPAPTLCPDCRQQRRISFRNERALYNRKCSKTSVNIISMYKKDSVFPVYSNDIWWGDTWDGKDYGMDFDFSRLFFEQIKELHDKVPHFSLAVASTTCENSDYVNHAGYLKDCYLVYNTDYAERCMYSKAVNRCFDCLDCFKIYDCEACYECMNSYNCKFCTYLWDSYNSSECHFSYNLIGCQNCFLCTNLRNQEYYFMNEKYTAEDWKRKVDEFKSKNSDNDIFQMFLKVSNRFSVKQIHENNTENCTGDYLVNCKNCFDCYDCEYMENSRYCYDVKKGDGVSYKNMDVSSFGVGLLECYEGGTIGYNDNHCLFCENVWGSSDLYYSMFCMNNCRNCFACVGLKKAEYCILNKQYSKDEYFDLMAKIIEHMMETGEWGEFFPTEISPFAYNETMAQEYFFMTQEEVLKKGWRWYESTDNTKKIDDSVFNDVLVCEETGKSFKLQKMELDFYEKMNLPVPKYCPDARHLRRLQYRNPRQLWDRECIRCKNQISSTYSPDRSENVYCEKCYLEILI